MGAPRRYLLEAALSHGVGSEDRLTELLATALDQDRDFADEYCRYFGIEPGQRYDVKVQVRTDVGTRVDMELVRRGAGQSAAVIWSEHKLDTQFHDRQLKYPEAQRRRYGESGQTVAIVKDSATIPQAWKGITWQRLSELADDAGRDSLGDGWRDLAMSRGSCAGKRVLAEFLWYLERQELAMPMQPLTSELLEVLSHRVTTTDAMYSLLEGVRAELQTRFPKSGILSDEGDWIGVSCAPPSGSWIERLGGDLDINFSVSDDWTPDRNGRPLFAAGACFRDPESCDRLSAAFSWREHVEAKDFLADLFEGERPFIVYRWVPAAKILEAGEALSDQVDWLMAWSEAVFDEILSRNPDQPPPDPLAE